MNNWLLKELKERIAERYGDLENDCGAYVQRWRNGSDKCEYEWLSIKCVVDMIDELDDDYPEE